VFIKLVSYRTSYSVFDRGLGFLVILSDLDSSSAQAFAGFKCMGLWPGPEGTADSVIAPRLRIAYLTYERVFTFR